MARIWTVVLPFVLAFVWPFALQRVFGWWLNSGRGVGLMLVGLFALAIVFARVRPERPWSSAIAVAAGGFAGSALVLISIGPGTIWPIVLVMAAVLSTVAALAGAWVVWRVTAISRR